MYRRNSLSHSMTRPPLTCLVRSLQAAEEERNSSSSICQIQSNGEGPHISLRSRRKKTHGKEKRLGRKSIGKEPRTYPEKTRGARAKWSRGVSAIETGDAPRAVRMRQRNPPSLFWISKCPAYSRRRPSVHPSIRPSHLNRRGAARRVRPRHDARSRCWFFLWPCFIRMQTPLPRSSNSRG